MNDQRDPIPDARTEELKQSLLVLATQARNGEFEKLSIDETRALFRTVCAIQDELVELGLSTPLPEAYAVIVNGVPIISDYYSYLYQRAHRLRDTLVRLLITLGVLSLPLGIYYLVSQLKK